MEIRQLENENIVAAGEHRIPGYVTDEPCAKCGHPKIYNETYDSFLCANCNLWMENQCRDSSCDRCKNRPERPLPVK